MPRAGVETGDSQYGKYRIMRLTCGHTLERSTGKGSGRGSGDLPEAWYKGFKASQAGFVDDVLDESLLDAYPDLGG